MTPLVPALAAALLLAPAARTSKPAPASFAPAAPPCDDARAVEAVRAAARDRLDLSTLQLVVEGPYGRSKFVRTHPTFPPGPAAMKKLANRTFWFVWFHPPFHAAGARGSDLWALVDTRRCDLLHVAPPR